jgi:proton translocating ATP synthase F1 alpha subunit
MSPQHTTREVGYVVESRDYLIHLEGLPSVRINDIIVGNAGQTAIVTSLSNNRIAANMLSRHKSKPGDEFSRLPAGLQIYEPLSLVGRLMNPLGEMLDDSASKTGEKIDLNLEPEALGISRRIILSQQLTTGLSMVDTLIPIGRGQRQLLFGEPTSGKTPFVLDLIINQNRMKTGTGSEFPHDQVICIYAAVGKAEMEVKRYIEQIKQHDGMKYTIVIAAFSSEPAPLIALTPSVALAIAERLRDQGYSTIVILDDLGTHAKYLREIALLSERVPGRESYPGDIFYQQAYLTERAGNFQVDGFKEAISITLLPLIETSLENFSSLIPTNVMATTDGHILFSSALRSEGRYPSIDLDRSVTRVGRQTQNPLFHELADKLRVILTEYEELKIYSRFGADTNNATLHQGELLYELLRQQQLMRIDLAVQAVYLTLIFTNFFIAKDLSYLRKNKAVLLKLIHEHPQFQQLQGAIPTLKLKQLIQILDQDPFRSLMISIGG